MWTHLGRHRRALQQQLAVSTRHGTTVNPADTAAPSVLVPEPSQTPPSLLRNIALNIGGRGLLTVLALLSTPLLVHQLGNETYGVYILALTMGGLLGLLDLGLTPAVITLLSRSWHHRAYDDMQKIISTALTFYLAIGAIGGVGIALLVPWMVTDLLHVPQPLVGAAQFALWLNTLAFALGMWMSVFSAIPVALERYDIITPRLVVLALITNATTIAFALLGGGLEGLVAINVLGTALGLGLFFAVSRSLLPGFNYRPGFDPGSFRSLAGFSVFKFAGTLGGALAFRFDQFAIGALLGLKAVSLYAIPANITMRIIAIIMELLAPLYPRASKLKGDQEAIHSLLLRGTHMIALFSGLLLTTLFVFADPVLQYWIGGDQGVEVARESSSTMRWLLAAFYIQALAAIPSIFCEALGRPDVNNGFAVASAIINVPLVLILVPQLGIVGAAVALFINSAIQTMAFIVFATRRVINMPISQLFWRAIARPLLAICAQATIGYFMRPLVRDLLSLVLVLLLMPLIFLACAVIVGAITREDIKRTAHLVKSFLTLVPKPWTRSA